MTRDGAVIQRGIVVVGGRAERARAGADAVVSTGGIGGGNGSTSERHGVVLFSEESEDG